MQSVIVPVYKVEQFLDQCVESVLQLKTDFELILVDDGSPDRCGEMCDEWARKDTRIRVIHQTNSGLSAARNVGIQNSKGDYILFLDSDDYLDAAETERLLEKCNGDVDVVVGLYRKVYTASAESFDENSPASLKTQRLMSVDSFLDALPLDGHSYPLAATRFICRRDFLIKNGLYFQEGIYHEDEEWNQRLFYSTSELFVSHYHFYQYRQARAGSIMAVVKPKRIFDRFTVIANGSKLLEKEDIKPELKDYLQKQAAWIYFANLVDFHVLTSSEISQTWEDYVRFKVFAAYLPGKKGMLVRLLFKMTGMKMTCRILHLMQTVKRRLKRS